MPLLTWLALVFFLGAIAAAAFYAVREAIRLFRTLGSSSARVGHALDEVSTTADEIARRLEALPAGGERLTVELERLSHSRSRLSLLLTRFADVRRMVTGARAGVLGK